MGLFKKDKDHTIKNGYIAGVMAMNERTISDNNRGLPSESQMFDYEKQQYGNRFDKEFDGLTINLNNDNTWTWNDKGFTQFMAIIYESFTTYMGGLWDYNDEMLDDLGLNKYELEERLNEAGSLAIIEDKGNKFALAYTITKTDVYGLPSEIKITGANKYFNDRIYKSGEFVILKSNQKAWNKIVENAPYFVLAYLCGCQFHDDITRGQTHYFYLNDGDWDNNSVITAKVINDFSKSRESVMSFSPKVNQLNVDGYPENNKQEDTFDKFSKSIQKLDFVDRTDQMWNSFQNALCEAFKYLGISVNMNQMKKERQITGEISIQEEIPSSQREAMFYMREYAIRKCNERFNTNWEITRLDKMDNEVYNEDIIKGDDKDE